jgi:preprotein translocase subunit SecA
MQEGEAIESRMVSRRIEGAQKKVEERNFDIRKNLLEYDEVMDEQRKRVYSFRQSLLEGASPKDKVLEMIDSQIQDAAARFLADDYGAASFAEWVGQRLGLELTAREIKGASFEDADEIARARAERQLHEAIREALDENLPADADPSEWTWQALVRWVNDRFELNLKDRDLKKYARTDGDEFQFGRDDLEEFLHEQAANSLQKIDLSPAREFLLPDWGRRSLSGWVHHKFTIAIDPKDWEGIDRAEIVRRIKVEARRLYTQKEAELPARIAMLRYLADRDAFGTPRYDREGLAASVSERYHIVVEAEELRPMLRPEIEAMILELARKNYHGGKVAEELESRLESAGLTRTPNPREKDAAAPDAAAIEALAQWARAHLDAEIVPDEFQSLAPAQIRNRLMAAFDAKFRPEMREMEKAVLLQILDSAWMEHLRAMDHLRSSIGLQGYAQIDPKVEYKREGMRIFADMWAASADRVTDLIYRVEQFDPEFLDYLGSRYNRLDRAQTIHSQAESQLVAAPAGAGVRQQQDDAIAASQQSTEKKKEPVRNVGKKVGRNDPCPCGSGKKFKACCMRKHSSANPF